MDMYARWSWMIGYGATIVVALILAGCSPAHIALGRA
jgi:hypothetical protein